MKELLMATVNQIDLTLSQIEVKGDGVILLTQARQALKTLYNALAAMEVKGQEPAEKPKETKQGGGGA